VFIATLFIGMPGPECAERFRGALDMALTLDRVSPALPPTNRRPLPDPTSRVGRRFDPIRSVCASGHDAPGEIPAVPEPPTWAMMFPGFGGIGFAMSRTGKRKIAQPA
jgi:hypothetical protein